MADEQIADTSCNASFVVIGPNELPELQLDPDYDILDKVENGEIVPLLPGISNVELARIHTTAKRFEIEEYNPNRSGIPLSDRIKAVAIPQFYLAIYNAIETSQDEEMKAAWQSGDLHVGLFGSFAVAIATVNILSDMDVLILINSGIDEGVQKRFATLISNVCNAPVNAVGKAGSFSGTEKEVKIIEYDKDREGNCSLKTNPHNLGTVNELYSWYQSQLAIPSSRGDFKLQLFPEEMRNIANTTIEKLHKKFDFMNVKNELIVALYNCFVYNHMPQYLSHTSSRYAELKFAPGGYSTFRNIHVILRAIRSMENGLVPSQSNDWEEFRWPSLEEYLSQIKVLETDDIELLRSAASYYGLYANNFAGEFYGIKGHATDVYKEILATKFGLTQEEIARVNVPTWEDFSAKMERMRSLNEKVIRVFMEKFEKYSISPEAVEFKDSLAILKDVWGDVISSEVLVNGTYESTAAERLMRPLCSVFGVAEPVELLAMDDDLFARELQSLTATQKTQLAKSYNGLYWLVNLGIAVSPVTTEKLLNKVVLLGNLVFDDNGEYLVRKAKSNAKYLFNSDI